jgi:hypothetical protein
MAESGAKVFGQPSTGGREREVNGMSRQLQASWANDCELTLQAVRRYTQSKPR